MCDCWKCLKSCPVRKLFTWFIWWWRVHCWQYNTRRVLKDYSFVYLSFLDSLQRRDLILRLCPCHRVWYMSLCFRCLIVVAAVSLQLRPVCSSQCAISGLQVSSHAVSALSPRCTCCCTRGDFVCKWKRFLSSICWGQGGISSFLTSDPSTPLSPFSL